LPFSHNSTFSPLPTSTSTSNKHPQNSIPLTPCFLIDLSRRIVTFLLKVRVHSKRFIFTDDPHIFRSSTAFPLRASSFIILSSCFHAASPSQPALLSTTPTLLSLRSTIQLTSLIFCRSTMDTKSENFGAMSVDIEGEPTNMQDLDSWLQRVSGRPSASTSTPSKPANVMSPPATPAAFGGLNFSAPPENMVPAQLVAKVERLTKKVSELESTMYYLKEEVAEMETKKMQLNQEIAGLSNAKSSIKTINQRLNAIQCGFSNLMDRVEVMEKLASLGDVVRSGNKPNMGAIEFTGGGGDGDSMGEALSNPGNPLNVLNNGPNRRGRNKHKRRAVDQGDRSTVAAPAFDGVGTTEGNSPEEIAKMEELYAMVVKKLAAMKMANSTAAAGIDDGSVTTGASTSSGASADGGDVTMGGEASGHAKEEQMAED
ncbi:hypothetical protein V8F20_001662, partial [Naviculisporaceae sp. PSN 640]